MPGFYGLLLVCILADAQVVRQQGTSEDAEHLRRMLANQPDYTAVPWHFFKNEAGIVGGEGSKVVKMGNRLAEVIANTILIYEPGKPTIKVFPKRKEYAEVTIERKDDFAVPRMISSDLKGLQAGVMSSSSRRVRKRVSTPA